jgi:nucleotide-binding universal stress UspA family protein
MTPVSQPVSNKIVVGIDGSQSSFQALSWAADEARLRNCPLHILHVWRVPLSVAAPEPSVLGHQALPEAPLEAIQATPAHQAGGLLERAAETVDDVDVRVEAIEGSAAVELIRAAAGADLLGSVAQQCAIHVSCPVVIVPAHSAEDQHPQ